MWPALPPLRIPGFVPLAFLELVDIPSLTAYLSVDLNKGYKIFACDAAKLTFAEIQHHSLLLLLTNVQMASQRLKCFGGTFRVAAR